MPAAINDTINKKIEDLKTVKDKDDSEAIKAAVKALSEELQKIGESLYNKKDNGPEPNSN